MSLILYDDDTLDDTHREIGDFLVEALSGQESLLSLDTNKNWSKAREETKRRGSAGQQK